MEAHLNDGLTNASSRAGKAIAALGIDHKELAAAMTDTGKLLALLREKFSQYRDGPDKLALAHDLLGRQVRALMPILNMTAAEFEAYDERVKATGADMSGPMLAAAAETGKNFNFLGLAVEGLSKTLYSAFEPALDTVVTGLPAFAEAITNNIREGGNLAPVLGSSSARSTPCWRA